MFFEEHRKDPSGHIWRIDELRHTELIRVQEVFPGPSRFELIDPDTWQEWERVESIFASEWITAIPREKLNILHHALRMLAQHPMTKNEEEVAKLADVLWEESCRRDGVSR